ncbi:MAG TPA: response regulator [Sedimenticola thiotaurini]|uniref:histidine kinase n=1 Tax=Sedimenticola thiotaurini TaxID=1543721 RepID=A0A831RMG2_9GAMM|nr:response regulator [Sedimenticola thiotaurini]
MKLRTQILLFFLLFALTPLILAVVINLPLVLERMELFYHKAHLQNLRADFRDLDQHLASRDEMVQLLAKLPEPGTILGGDRQQDGEAIDKARARYTLWINRILGDQLDIIELVFLDDQGRIQFWLQRDKTSQEWLPTAEPPQLPDPRVIRAALNAEPGNVLVSPISLNPVAGSSDPRRFMTLRLIGPIPDPSGNGTIGAIMMVIDVGGIARSYRNTLWVHNDGHFLEHAGPNAPVGDAFERFPGLRGIFAQGKPALWKGDGQQIMWIPMFRTEQSGPLWVGRRVDPSPIAQFRNALTLRVLSIVFALALVVWLAARWIARRAERLSSELLAGVRKVLNDEGDVHFDWHRPQELRELGESLSRLAREHGRNTRNLRAHARKLEESNRYKSQFLANVSHELRTPLNSILLLSKLLGADDSGLTPEQKQQARVIHEAGRDLQALINDILDLSRIEARRTTVHLEWIDLPRLLHGIMELVEPQFQDKGLPLRLEIADDAPRRIRSDPDKIRQVLKNFLSNALKFTDSGSVVLRLQGMKRGQECNCDLGISVRDSGIGIPPSQQAHIFEAFRQADGSTSRRYGGTGLGLAISQQLAHLLCGEIRLDSAEGEGSTFTLLLPLECDPERPTRAPSTTAVPDTGEEAAAPAGDQAAEPAREGEIVGHRVLLVDDDLRNLLALTPVLEGWGLEVTAAGDGNEALEVLAEEEFSVVLMDIMMPGMDGYDTIRRIRAGGRNRDVAIIALTAKAGDDDRVASLEAGADDFLSKPVDTEELKQIIARHLPFIDT